MPGQPGWVFMHWIIRQAAHAPGNVCKAHWWLLNAARCRGVLLAASHGDASTAVCSSRCRASASANCAAQSAAPASRVLPPVAGRCGGVGAPADTLQRADQS